MKSLQNLNNFEKAKLLFELLPGSIGEFLQFLKEETDYLLQNPNKLLDNWQTKFVSFDFWMMITKEAQNSILKFGDNLRNRSSLFANELFKGYFHLYTVHQLQQFVSSNRNKNYNFKLAVELLFGSSSQIISVKELHFVQQLLLHLEIPFDYDQVGSIEANTGTAWITLKDGKCYSFTFIECK